MTSQLLGVVFSHAFPFSTTYPAPPLLRLCGRLAPLLQLAEVPYAPRRRANFFFLTVRHMIVEPFHTPATPLRPPYRLHHCLAFHCALSALVGSSARARYSPWRPEFFNLFPSNPNRRVPPYLSLSVDYLAPFCSRDRIPASPHSIRSEPSRTELNNFPLSKLSVFLHSQRSFVILTPPFTIRRRLRPLGLTIPTSSPHPFSCPFCSSLLFPSLLDSSLVGGPSSPLPLTSLLPFIAARKSFWFPGGFARSCHCLPSNLCCFAS